MMRVCVDTLVFGGCFDTAFEEWSNKHIVKAIRKKVWDKEKGEREIDITSINRPNIHMTSFR